ncbi:MAG TPA: tripartite tricarboxylate transporter substrate binding protein [Burkholderiales bacterium]|nr:tripartite tricarboxylate transporter substrate binding protein [Burkholderiales bacterium]
MRKLLALLLLGFAALASAQGYPNKAVRVIVSFTPGSSTDIVGRIVMAKVSGYWGQPVVVENRGGAGGSIGSAVVAKAEPDGYTLLINSNAHCVNPAIYASLPYDTTKDFVDVVPLAIQPNVLTVRPDGQYKTVADLVSAAKARPGAVNIGHAGVGSGTHLNTEKFIAAAGISVLQVPFKGTPEVITAMMSGNVDAYWAPISAAMGSIRGGKLRPLAVSTAKRNPQLPDVPTTAESGLRGAEAPLWFGLWAPAGLPQELVAKINADVRKALSDPTVKERLVNGGNETLDMAPQEFARFVRSEIDDYTRVLRAAGVKPQ